MQARSFGSAIIREEAKMGLLDVLNGMQNGPRGQQDPNAKGGMSPITMAILALLAYKGIKHVAGSVQQAPSPGAPAPSRIPQGRTIDANAEAPAGGGLGDILGGLLGGGAQAPGGQSRMPGGPAQGCSVVVVAVARGAQPPAAAVWVACWAARSRAARPAAF
jgi:hypothetical protein